MDNTNNKEVQIKTMILAYQVDIIHVGFKIWRK